MKSILISIKPKWVKEILYFNKTIEIRKTLPKCKLPCKVYIYCGKQTNARDTLLGRNCKIVGEFTLKCFNKFDIKGLKFYDMEDVILKKGKLTEEQLQIYIKNKIGYAWHIDDLKVYDAPKNLSEFNLKRPPQSWCYVESL